VGFVAAEARVKHRCVLSERLKQKPRTEVRGFWEDFAFILRRRQPIRLALSAKTKSLDQRTVTCDVNALEVSEKAATLTDHEEQATTAVVVVLVLLEVLGEVLDALAENSNLNLRRTGVTWVGCILVDNCGLYLWVKCHSSIPFGSLRGAHAFDMSSLYPRPIHGNLSSLGGLCGERQP
jgi:hypothetical protein